MRTSDLRGFVAFLSMTCPQLLFHSYFSTTSTDYLLITFIHLIEILLIEVIDSVHNAAHFSSFFVFLSILRASFMLIYYSRLDSSCLRRSFTTVSWWYECLVNPTWHPRKFHLTKKVWQIYEEKYEHIIASGPMSCKPMFAGQLWLFYTWIKIFIHYLFRVRHLFFSWTLFFLCAVIDV